MISLHKLRSTNKVVFRASVVSIVWDCSGRMLSAGTASAPQKQRTLLAGSSDSWDCTIVRPIETHLLFRQDKKDFGSFTSHEENGFKF